MNLSDLDDVVFGKEANKYLEDEIKKYEDKTNEYINMMKESIMVEDMLKSIVNSSPEKSYNNWRRENNIWVLYGHGCIDFYSWKVNNKPEYLNRFFDLLNIEHEIVKCELITNDCVRYHFEYKITLDEYEKIKKYYENISNMTDEKLKLKLTDLEIESMPDWKRKYIDSKFKTSNIVKKINN